MKNFKTILFTIALFLISYTGSAQAAGGGWNGNTNYNRLYDPATVIEIRGSISSIEKIIPSKGMSMGIHLNLITDKKEHYSVHLGPDWYLQNQAMKFNVGDVILVSGSKITYKNAPTIIASSVSKGKSILILRDKKGFPAWSGARQTRRAGKRSLQ